MNSDLFTVDLRPIYCSLTTLQKAHTGGGKGDSLGQPPEAGVGAVAVGLRQPGVEVGLDGDGGGEARSDVLAVVHGNGQRVRGVHHDPRPRAVQDVRVQRVDTVGAGGRLVVVQEHHQAVGGRTGQSKGSGLIDTRCKSRVGVTGAQQKARCCSGRGRQADRETDAYMQKASERASERERERERERTQNFITQG